MISPEATISYPTLFTPRLPPNAKPGDVANYSATFLFTEAATKTPEFQAIKDAVITAARDKWGAKADDMIRTGALRLPFRKDVEAKGYPAEYVLFINARSKDKPGVVSRYAGPDGKPVPVTEPLEVFAGCKVRASFSVYSYEAQGNKGVSLGLRNVQKLADGDRLDGRVSAENEFAALDAMPAALPDADRSNLADLL